MDPIANFLSRIKNAQMVKKEVIKIPYSKVKLALAKILVKAGYLESVDKKGRGWRRSLLVKLKYKDGQPAISAMRRISKLGQRVYIRHKKIIPIKSGYGLTIISTSRGLMTNKEARKQGLGGEVICEVW